MPTLIMKNILSSLVVLLLVRAVSVSSVFFYEIVSSVKEKEKYELQVRLNCNRRKCMTSKWQKIIYFEKSFCRSHDDSTPKKWWTCICTVKTNCRSGMRKLTVWTLFTGLRLGFETKFWLLYLQTTVPNK